MTTQELRAHLEVWDRQDLVRRVHIALDVASAVIASVLSAPDRVDLNALEAPVDKVVSETAMLLAAIARVPEKVAPDVAARVEHLVNAITPHARNPRIRTALALHPALALDYAAPHLVLRNAGWPDPAMDEVLDRALSSSCAKGRERVPHRELEQAWLSRLAGTRVTGCCTLERSTLVTGIDLLTGSRDDVYALTHATLYATDFGSTSLPSLPRPVSEVRREAESALAGALDDDDFDLAGELLITGLLLDPTWTPTMAFAFHVLAETEDMVGILPSLSLDNDAYLQVPKDSRRQYAAASTYHTAYVMGLLCALILSGGTPPPAGQSPLDPLPADADLGLVTRLRDALHEHPRNSQLEQRLTSLPADELPTLAPVLLDVLVRRAIRRLDLVDVRRHLETAVLLPGGTTALASQAADLLHRLTHLP